MFFWGSGVEVGERAGWGLGMSITKAKIKQKEPVGSVKLLYTSVK